jgi:hypothetical protein
LTYQGDGRNNEGKTEGLLYDTGLNAVGADYSEAKTDGKTPFCALGRKGSYTNDQHMISVTLERSTMFNLAGVPVNNSRVLALRGTISPDSGDFKTDGTGPNPAVVRQLDIYLKYVKLARVFLNNVEVEQ